jgi:transketolase
MDLGSIKNKFESFGFEALEVDGHNEDELDLAITSLLNSTSEAPKAIIAKTVKGKGVSFMEGNNIWHYTRLNATTHSQALLEIMKD